jgi:hypothetical protein
MLATALIGDLILLPALLAGPAGRFFKPRTDAKRNPINAEQTNAIVPKESNEPVQQGSETQISDSQAPAALKVHFPNERTDPPHRVR